MESGEAMTEYTQFEKRWGPRFQLVHIGVGGWRLGVLVCLNPAVELVLWLGTYQATVSLTYLQALPLREREA